MLLFCPTCANILECEEGISSCYRFSCSTCPYVYNITKRISSRTYTKLKEVDDVLGGSAAWENVDSIEEPCPKCHNKRAYFMQIQTRYLWDVGLIISCNVTNTSIRSADEPMTTFYKCTSGECGHRWRE